MEELTYDPEREVDAGEWLGLDEGERIALVASYHQRARERVPNAQLHAAIHAAVENQLASREAEVVAALARLRSGGLSRRR
jgi:hypothetical protein